MATGATIPRITVAMAANITGRMIFCSDGGSSKYNKNITIIISVIMNTVLQQLL